VNAPHASHAPQDSHAQPAAAASQALNGPYTGQARHTPTPAQAAPAQAPASQGRRIRWFLAAHLAAVGSVAAVAWFIGGGWSLSMPPVEGPATAPGAQTLAAGTAAAPIDTASSLPAWSQRVDVNAPWEQR
jgi:hypothetical protein